MPLVLAGTGGRPSHPDSHRHRPRLPPNSAAASPSGLGFELFGSGPFPTESLVPSLPWLPSVKCISAVGFKTAPFLHHFCTISAPFFDFGRCSFASRRGTRRIDGVARHRGMEHFHDARTRRTQRNNRTRERTPNHENQPERKQRGWHGKTLPFLYRLTPHLFCSRRSSFWRRKPGYGRWHAGWASHGSDWPGPRAADPDCKHRVLTLSL